ncbi:MAG TPA: hypothetical protein VFN77_03095 [Acetobacteraceae bacterium]|nr:hypothetical protein [Acetobacteraceae bacterium]
MKPRKQPPRPLRRPGLDAPFFARFVPIMAEAHSAEPPKEAQGTASEAARREREARALRENLMRRKAQLRARADQAPEQAPDSTPCR